MSIDCVDRKVLVELELAKSHSTMEECELLAGAKRWSGAAGRLYYAVFHAVCAILIHDGHRVKTHKGAGVVFSQEYIHKSVFPAAYGELFFQLESVREKSDYDCFYDVTEDEVLSRIPMSKEMIATISEVVRNDNRM